MNKISIPTPKKSICFVADFLFVGGRESVLADVTDLLVADYDVTVVTFYDISKEMLEKLSPEVTVHSNTAGNCGGMIDYARLSMPIIGNLKFHKYIPGYYDYLVLTQASYPLAAYSNKGKKVIFWVHTDKDVMYADSKNLSFLRKLNKLRLQIGYRKVDATWVVADYIGERLRKAFDISNVYTLDNPIDAQKIIAQANEITPDVVDPSYFHYVMVGRLSHEKGHIRALQAFKKISSEHRCKMLIVGDGYERNSLEKYVLEHGLTDRVIFVGHQKNPYPYIKSADAMVLPSEYESFGVVLLEAMILNVPVMSTATIGGKRVTNSGAYGILVENTDDGIEQGMRQCLDRAHTKQKYVDKAYTWALTFDKHALKSRLDELLKD